MLVTHGNPHLQAKTRPFGRGVFPQPLGDTTNDHHAVTLDESTGRESVRIWMNMIPVPGYWLVAGFKYVFLMFTPKIGEDVHPFWPLHICSKGLGEKPPTRNEYDTAFCLAH